MMTESELLKKLDELRALPYETEWVEFKEAKSNYDFRKLGKYFSAIANEANLNHKQCGWLVFGVVNCDHSICGSSFREDPEYLDKLKHEIAAQTDGVSFTDIHVVNHPNGRVVIFEIPPAPAGMPVHFQGHYYGRDGEALVPLNISELERIRRQSRNTDWSAVICEKATIEDLDTEAIQRARQNFASTVAAATGKHAEYIRNRPFDDAHYKKLIIEYLKKFGTATKSDIESLLLDKLSDVLSLQQKKNKIRNMLHQMAIKDHTITTYQKGRYAKWKLF